MKQPYVFKRKSSLPYFFVTLFFLTFIHQNTHAQVNASVQNMDKQMKPIHFEKVDAPNDVRLDQLVSRIVQIQNELVALGTVKPTEKALNVHPLLFPNIPLTESVWPENQVLRKIIASHFDQGETYLEFLKSTFEEVKTSE